MTSSEDSYTVLEYFRGFLHEYIRDEDLAETWAHETISQMDTADADTELTDEIRNELESRFIGEGTTPKRVIHEEMTNQVDSDFADTMAPFYSLGFLHLSFFDVENPSEEVPQIIGKVIRSRTRDRFEDGQFDEYIQAYRNDDLQNPLS